MLVEEQKAKIAEIDGEKTDMQNKMEKNMKNK